MAKGIYHSVDVEKVVPSALVALATTAVVIVGVDVAKLDLLAAFALQGGSILQLVRFRQTTQMQRFLDLIAALVQAGRSVQLVLEATGTYGDALREHAHKVGAAIVMMAPKHVRDARELFDGVASKHDPKDATLLARLRAQGLGAPWKPLEPLRRELRALVETRDLYHDPLMQGYSRLEALLARHWPELTSNVDLYQTVSLWGLLAQIPDPHRIAAEPEQAREVLREQSRGSLNQEAIEAILRCARQTVGVAPTANESDQIRRTVSEMLRQRAEVRAIDRKLCAQMEAQDAFASLSQWLSPTTTAVLVACVGDPRSFHHAAAFEKACGLNLKEQSSGSSLRRGLHITKRGASRARKYLYLFALRWMTRDATARAWVQHRGNWSRKGGKTSALVALMRKAARAAWHLARGEDYQASKLFDVRRLELASTPPEPPTRTDKSDARSAPVPPQASPETATADVTTEPSPLPPGRVGRDTRGRFVAQAPASSSSVSDAPAPSASAALTSSASAARTPLARDAPTAPPQPTPSATVARTRSPSDPSTPSSPTTEQSSPASKPVAPASSERITSGATQRVPTGPGQPPTRALGEALERIQRLMARRP